MRRDWEAERSVRNTIISKSAILLIARISRIVIRAKNTHRLVAQVFLSFFTVNTISTAASEPWHTDLIPHFHRGNILANLFCNTHDLVSFCVSTTI